MGILQSYFCKKERLLQMSTPSYIPALRYHWLTKSYDFFLRITFPEKKIKQALIAQLNLKGTETILDFGCGGGTLAIMIKEQYPAVNIIGVDVDDHVLAIAEKKIKNKGLNIPLKKYEGENLPFNRNQQFDKIVSSLVFHHIPTNVKRIILNQLYNIVKPGGELHIADFGKPANLYTKVAFGLFRRFDGVENTKVNAEGFLPDFIRRGGFNDVRVLFHQNTAFGTIDFITAKSLYDFR